MSVDTTSANLTAGVDPSRARITGAIKQASNATGASFEYLLATAKMESDFNPAAGAATSSARGLYQFIEQTWLGTVKEAGGQLGYGKYADAINKTASGSYAVDDPAMQRAIMQLRDDPVASSAMAGVLTQSNSFKLTGMIGRRPTDGELYMAHFMGVSGAARLISCAEDRPQASAARLFPDAAAANNSTFYDRYGRARSVSEVYAVLNARYSGAVNSTATRSAMAMFGDTPRIEVANSAPASALAPAIDNAAYLSAFPDIRGATPVAGVPAPLVSDNASSPGAPVFRSLFQAGDRAEPVSATVRELWGNSPLASAGSLPSHPEVRAPQPLDLFSDRNGTFSG